MLEHGMDPFKDRLKKLMTCLPPWCTATIPRARTARRPSAWSATDQTVLVWPCSVLRHAPMSRSHTRTVLSGPVRAALGSSGHYRWRPTQEAFPRDRFPWLALPAQPRDFSSLWLVSVPDPVAAG